MPNSISIQYLENKWTELHQILYICNNIDKIYVGIVTQHILIVCMRVALDLLQNFVTAQYLEYKWTYFDQTLYKY